MSELEKVQTSSFPGKTPGERLKQALAYAKARTDDHPVEVVLDESGYNFEGQFPFSGMRVNGNGS
jgi:hypothetical protein